MNSVIGRVLTGICGGLVMAAVNHWNSLKGWAYGGSIAAGFLVFFFAAIWFERRSSKRSAPAGRQVGSHNETQGRQEITIGATAVAGESATVGSGNKSSGDQSIKIG